MAFKLNCIGIIRQNSNGKFEFVVRWFINDDSSNKITHLPNPEGKFNLYIRTKLSNEYIKADGSLAKIPTAGGLSLPEIPPLNYLMVAPPKSGLPLKPIDPNKNPEKDNDAGVGIYHLLAESSASRYSKKIFDKTTQALHIKKAFISNQLFSEISIGEFTNGLVRYVHCRPDV